MHPRPVALIAVALALSASCTRLPSGATAVEAVQVSEANLAAHPELGLAADRAQLAVQGALESSGKFALRPRGARIRVEVEHARRLPGPADRDQAEVMVSLELQADADGDRLLAEGLGRQLGDAEGELRVTAFEGALRGAVKDASLALAYQLDARKKSDAELIADLAANDPRVRDHAVRVLADRRNPAAVPNLVARLNDESPVVVLRAIGALVAIGDRRAVRPLIELTRKRPPQIVAQILYALGSLGGAEAESFLYTLESGAAEEEVRRAAAEAFADLHRKQSDAPQQRTVVP
jgi:hypothetical protein